MKKRLRVLMLFNTPYATPRGYDFAEEFADAENMYTEQDVYQALLDNNYIVSRLGLFNSVLPLFAEVESFQPDVIFNMMEVFHNQTCLDKNMAALLELIGVPFTGASSGSLFLCNDKAMGKKILRYHRVRVPRFQAFYRGHKIWLPKTLTLPCIVKPLGEEASRGIAQASIVDSAEAFQERIRFIHEHMEQDAIAEEYVDGRELYVSVMGQKRLRVLPPREMSFGQMPEDEPRIATYKAKWDDKYRAHWGIKNTAAGRLAEGVQARINDVCKRSYRALNLSSYARFDLRITPTGQVFVIEPNVNPCLARKDEIAQSAEKIGLSYPALIRNIVTMAFQRQT